MQITKVEVWVYDGNPAEGISKRQEVKDASGYGTGPVGELIVERAVTEMAENGQVGKTRYPAVMFAPGTWFKVECEAKASTILLPQKRKIEAVH